MVAQGCLDRGNASHSGVRGRGVDAAWAARDTSTYVLMGEVHDASGGMEESRSFGFSNFDSKRMLQCEGPARNGRDHLGSPPDLPLHAISLVESRCHNVHAANMDFPPT